MPSLIRHNNWETPCPTTASSSETNATSPPLGPEDAERSTQWDNDLEVALRLGDEAWTPTGLESTREQIVEALRQHAHLFAIVDLASDELIGRCVLFQVDHVNRSAMMGIVIGEKGYWGRGNGREAIYLLLGYDLNLLNLNNVMPGTFSFNERALRCYQAVDGMYGHLPLTSPPFADTLLPDSFAPLWGRSAISTDQEA